MNFEDWTFWGVILVATIVRVLSSPFHSIFRSLLMIVTSLIFAHVFVGPVLDWLRLDPETYKLAVGVLLAFTADGIMRIIILASTNPKELVDLIRRLRGLPIVETSKDKDTTK